jgi:hypothetical protein
LILQKEKQAENIVKEKELAEAATKQNQDF